MKCQICSEREARVHYTEMKDDEIKTLRLCEQCAEARGFTKMAKKSEFSLPDLLAGMAEEESAGIEAEQEEPRCESCGLTYAEFKNAGRLGCAECYESFAAALLPLLKRIHGSEHHVGKIPRSMRVKGTRAEKLAELRSELDRCVDEEDFERAAEIRDRIRQLEESRGT